MLNKRDRLNYEDIWRTTEAAVPSNRAHLGSLYIGAKASDLHTEPPLVLSFSLISRINHRAATLLPSSFSSTLFHTHTHSLSFSLYRCMRVRTDAKTQARTPPPAEILFRAVEIPVFARFLPRLAWSTTKLTNGLRPSATNPATDFEPLKHL